MSYRVCIPCAGTGSRLGPLTRFINKALVSVANRPALAHIIDKFPTDSEFVIALGYKGHLIKEFLALAYPSRTFFFVQVSPYEGEGSGLGRSLLACQEFLQQPFVFNSCDTLVAETIPPPEYNWMGYAERHSFEQYRTVELQDGLVRVIAEKSDVDDGRAKPYIGLAAVNDHDEFWSMMLHGGDNAILTGEVHGLRGLLPLKIHAHGFTWHDTGNLPALERTREAYSRPNQPNILEKANEAIWFHLGQVVKFSDDPRFIDNRVKRAGILRGYVPRITGAQPHMYSYDEAPGEVLSKVVTLPLFERLLGHCTTFWARRELAPSELHVFHNDCMKFYKEKTLERVDLFYKTFGRCDGAETINDRPMPRLSFMLQGLNWDWLAAGIPGRFHGDLHFENILWNVQGQQFTFLDWRQDFAGDLSTGDLYYDLAKILHGLIVCHELIAANQFRIQWEADSIDYDFHRKQVLVACEAYFYRWMGGLGFDVRKVKVLTALIFLNIAALHHEPYGLLLYALGKAMLASELEGL